MYRRLVRWAIVATPSVACGCGAGVSDRRARVEPPPATSSGDAFVCSSRSPRGAVKGKFSSTTATTAPISSSGPPMRQATSQRGRAVALTSGTGVASLCGWSAFGGPSCDIRRAQTMRGHGEVMSTADPAGNRSIITRALSINYVALCRVAPPMKQATRRWPACAKFLFACFFAPAS